MTTMTTTKILVLALLQGDILTRAQVGTLVVPINGYVPSTDVSHQMALSRDKTLVERLVNDQKFEHALQVYSQGGYSVSTATVKIKDDGGLSEQIPEGTFMTGTANNGKQVTGMIDRDATKGSTSLDFRYPAIGDENEFYNCNVGGLPDDYVNTDGCLAPHGEIQTEDGKTTFKYEYTVHDDTRNTRHLASLSTRDNKRMRPNEEQP